jgi:flavin-dependent dehydrogenase
VIERTIFDRHLLQRVAEAGDNVMMKTKVVGLGLGLDPGPGLQSRPGNARGKKVVL